MAAPTKNQFWKSRISHGAKPKFKDPESLWAACVDYFEWNGDHPFTVHKICAGKAVKLNKARPMSINGLCLHIGISRRTWANWKKRQDLLPVIRRVNNVIRLHQFEGAAAGIFNARILAWHFGRMQKETP